MRGKATPKKLKNNTPKQARQSKKQNPLRKDTDNPNSSCCEGKLVRLIWKYTSVRALLIPLFSIDVALFSSLENKRQDTDFQKLPRKASEYTGIEHISMAGPEF